jgi:predicted alpha/beta-hydrolase family hydrolase
MARRLRIEWRQGDKVTGLLAMPPRPRSLGVLLAHGAGAGQRSWFMETVRDGIAGLGYPVMTFDYPYIEAGRRRPDHASRLEQCHLAASGRFAGYVDGMVLAGKSMGGRIGGHIAAEAGAVGLVFLGYPLVSGGRARPLDHLVALDLPKLFVSGTRDPMAPLAQLRRAVGALPAAEGALIEGGDHSLKVPKGRLPHADVLEGVVHIIGDWLDGLQEGGLR